MADGSLKYHGFRGQPGLSLQSASKVDFLTYENSTMFNKRKKEKREKLGYGGLTCRPTLPSFPPSISSVSVPFSSLSIQSRLNRYPKLENKLFFFSVSFFLGSIKTLLYRNCSSNNQGT
jgi:hypothetical protein